MKGISKLTVFGLVCIVVGSLIFAFKGVKPGTPESDVVITRSYTQALVSIPKHELCEIYFVETNETSGSYHKLFCFNISKSQLMDLIDKFYEK